jgi:hypothetical protein
MNRSKHDYIDADQKDICVRQDLEKSTFILNKDFNQHIGMQK